MYVRRIWEFLSVVSTINAVFEKDRIQLRGNESRRKHDSRKLKELPHLLRGHK